MPLYEVDWQVTDNGTYLVEAESTKEAVRRAWEEWEWAPDRLLSESSNLYWGTDFFVKGVRQKENL